MLKFKEFCFIYQNKKYLIFYTAVEKTIIHNQSRCLNYNKNKKE